MERAAGLARVEAARTFSGRCLTEYSEHLDEVETEWMRQGAERARIGDLHNTKDIFGI